MVYECTPAHTDVDPKKGHEKAEDRAAPGKPYMGLLSCFGFEEGVARVPQDLLAGAPRQKAVRRAMSDLVILAGFGYSVHGSGSVDCVKDGKQVSNHIEDAAYCRAPDNALIDCKAQSLLRAVWLAPHVRADQPRTHQGCTKGWGVDKVDFAEAAAVFGPAGTPSGDQS
ncbi:MAG: hypothetical protein FRX49_10411 [Trebouxia sp. A1-2]|nr:MAG: hypothetical protein FRX49_10411 [Trebouxia sp. A1-2]